MLVIEQVDSGSTTPCHPMQFAMRIDSEQLQSIEAAVPKSNTTFVEAWQAQISLSAPRNPDYDPSTAPREQVKPTNVVGAMRHRLGTVYSTQVKLITQYTEKKQVLCVSKTDAIPPCWLK